MDNPDRMLERMLHSQLRELLSISYVVLANNQVTHRHLERVHDMPVQCWSALLAVVDFPGLRARDVVRMFPRPQNTVSRALALLQGRGLIEQRGCPDDARAKRLHPTATGRALLERMRVTALARQEEIFGVLDPEERATFLRLCHKLARGPHLSVSKAMTAELRTPSYGPVQPSLTGIPLAAGVPEAWSPLDNGESGFSSGK